MAATDAQIRRTPAAITAAPGRASPTGLSADGDASQPLMPYSCQTCAKRKVKCDKATPACSSCRKGRLECCYQAPPPRRRRRKLSDDVNQRLARYERILHQHGLLPQDADTSPSNEETPQETVSLRFNEPVTSNTGRLLAVHGQLRYVDSHFWRNVGDDEMQRMSYDEEEDQVDAGVSGGFVSDPLTGAFMGSHQSLLQYHPTHADAMKLWKMHVENVEPICKVLHIPSTLKMLEIASQQPAMASKADECLLFAIYHFAVYSMTDEACAKAMSQSRDTLMQRYHFATRQALVNAAFLQTTDMSILQALVLFLLACRHIYDATTYWILTGVAIRIGQRMGLHRDGEKLGLPPFDVQMRRRLFYQLIPLDGAASQLSGTGISIEPDSWDTQQPLNINDDQIWPGMTEAPEEQKGATEMIFCLARACIGTHLVRAGRSNHVAGSAQPKDHTEPESTIREAECDVEEQYIRYCDIVNPLHFLTICFARSAITAIRLKIRLPKVRNKTATDMERKEVLQLSQKIMDTDTAAFANASLRKYLWHEGSFFFWGSWDALILVLTSLRHSDLLSPTESDAAWSRVDQIYANHGQLLESKLAFYIAVRRLTLKAWDANPPSSSVPTPAFITSLRALSEFNRKSRAERQDSNATSLNAKTETTSMTDPSAPDHPSTFFGTLLDGMDLDVGYDFNLDDEDWMVWDHLIQNCRAHGG